YKNGVRAQKASLDEIIADDNSGKWKIQGLKMALLGKPQPQRTQIEIEFRVPPPQNKDATKRSYSILYNVVGNERDWVYLTGSQLDDRIAYIKQLPTFDYGLYAIVIGLIMLVTFLTILFSTSSSKLPLGYEIIAILASSLIICSGIACIYGFPQYNFCWGDYTKTFTQRRTIGKNVINGVIISLVVSVIGSILATLFFLK
ncbi:MAG TPA: hypothetical protein VEP90_17075, partial [Methylomirabilota bacterium]|nr:hypothetical protein [Methylomirabilota bacterium]